MDVSTVQVKCDSLTFVIFTYNEERRLPFVLSNLINFGRILIADGHSTDKTLEIARAHGCDILMRDDGNIGYAEHPYILAQIWAAVQTEWIYWGFADEIADEATLNAIVSAIESSKFQIVNIARKNYYYGTFIDQAFVHRMNRIFKMDAIDFRGNKIHHFGRVTVPEEQICYLDANKYFVHHFISNDAKSFLEVWNKYTDIDGATYQGSLSGFVLGLKLTKLFVLEYLIHGAYRSGFAGLALVLMMMYYRCLVWMKANEISHGLKDGGIERLNDEKRMAILDAMDKGNVRG